MLLGDTSHGTLHKKGTDNDEPYPQGTWAHQKVLWHIWDAQSVMGTGKGDGRSCQT